MKKRGKFIVIEGVDGCGKTTQYELLKARLKSEVGKLKLIDFPRYYDSVWGRLVGEFLVGKHGDFKTVSPYLVVFPYMIDQYTWSRDVGRKWIEKGGWILANRYFTSNTHQIAKLKGKAKNKFRNWIWNSGFEELDLLKPDLVIFLDVKPEIAKKLNKNKKERLYLKGRKKDLAEKDFEHQKKAYKEYLFSVKNFSYWKKVLCVTKNSIDSPEVIHNRIWNLVKRNIN